MECDANGSRIVSRVKPPGPHLCVRGPEHNDRSAPNSVRSTSPLHERPSSWYGVRRAEDFVRRAWPGATTRSHCGPSRPSYLAPQGRTDTWFDAPSTKNLSELLRSERIVGSCIFPKRIVK